MQVPVVFPVLQTHDQDAMHLEVSIAHHSEQSMMGLPLQQLQLRLLQEEELEREGPQMRTNRDSKWQTDS